VKKLFILLLVLIMSFSLFGQDIVYDSLRGNHENWLRITAGPQEKIVQLVYENTGVLTKSKILQGAGILDGLVKDVDYKMYHFNYDTLSYEISTDQPINCIIYKYIYNDTVYLYFVGFRKADLGSSMFEGQYLAIVPLNVKSSVTNIYDGIGASRKLICSLNATELSDLSIRDFELSNKGTIQGMFVSRYTRSAKTKNFTTYVETNVQNDVMVWPNPVSTILNLAIKNNPGVIIRIYDHTSKLMYDNHLRSEITEISFANYSSGIYYLLITNYHTGILIKTIKIIKI
jgi:hypothetical protein